MNASPRRSGSSRSSRPLFSFSAQRGNPAPTVVTRANGKSGPVLGKTGGIDPVAQLQEDEWWNKPAGTNTATQPEPAGSQYANAPSAAAPVGTSANPSPSTVNPARPNSGGTISTGLKAQPSGWGKPEDRASDAMTSTGLTRTIAPEAAQSQPVNPNVGTEKANPMTGAPAAAPAAPAANQPRANSGGTITTSMKTPAGPWGKAEDRASDSMGKTGLTRTIAPEEPNHAQDLGISQRGSSVPGGSDTLPGSGDVGSSGLFNRSFTNPKAGNIYASYVRGLFADGGIGSQSGEGA